MSNEQDKAEYEIGYKRPPKGSQFKKGQSGNRNGRAKGLFNLATELHRELATYVTVNENGRSKRVKKGSLAVKQIVNKAASGELKAFGFLSSWNNFYEQNQQAKGELIPEVLLEADHLVMTNILRRIRERDPIEAESTTASALTEQPDIHIDSESSIDNSLDFNFIEDEDEGDQS